MAVLHDNTSRIQGLIADISTLPKDRYEEGLAEGYANGHTDGVSEGYGSGYEAGRDVWNYIASLPSFDKAAFPAGTHLVLNIPRQTFATNVTVFNYHFRDVTGLEHLTLKCTLPQTQKFNAHGMFIRCVDLKILDLSEFNTNINAATDVFYGCKNLEEIRGEIEHSGAWTLWFHACQSLREVRFKKNSITKALGIGQSPLLSAESIQSIVDGLTDLNGGTTENLNLHADAGAKLTEEQKAIITAKNWTLVY